MLTTFNYLLCKKKAENTIVYLFSTLFQLVSSYFYINQFTYFPQQCSQRKVLLPLFLNDKTETQRCSANQSKTLIYQMQDRL